MGPVRRRFVWLRGVAIAVLLAAGLAWGQGAAAVRPETESESVVDVLHGLSDKADVIFAGQVLAIRRPNEGVVEVEFRVDQAVRGSVGGTTYILREWAGLWAAGGQRYRVGQRLLMMLHAPSVGGLSSPVGGLDGAIPIRQGGVGTSLANEATPLQSPLVEPFVEPFVDLRWLGVRLPRVVEYRSERVRPVEAGDANPNVPAVPVVARQMSVKIGALAEPGSIISAAPIVMSSNASSSEGSVPAQQASVGAVMEMLGSWEKARHVAP
jgi:hypothetical protein